MKRLFLLITVMLYQAVYSQNISENNLHDTTKVKLFSLYPGYVVTRKGDTLKGYVLLKNLIANQDKVIFYPTQEKNKEQAQKFKPKEVKAYKVGPRYYESYKFRPGVSSYATNDAKAYHFVLKVIDGPVSLYKWYYETTQRSEDRVKINEEHPLESHVDLSFDESDLKYITLFKKLDGEITKPALNFKKQMSKLLADYPELAKKIASKEKGYRSWDLEKIIREYNEWYLKNHSGGNH